MTPHKRQYIRSRLILGAALGAAATAISHGVHPLDMILGTAGGAAIYGLCAILLYRYVPK